jgi:hypothetical protein
MGNKNFYEFKSDDFMLVKFDMDIKYAEMIEAVLEKLDNDEFDKIKFYSDYLPFLSSTENDESFWDIIFLDSKIKKFVESILIKYNVEFTSEDITELYYEKSEKLGIDFIKEIDDFLDNHLEIDGILDKINSDGINSLKKYELNFLKKQSTK